LIDFLAIIFEPLILDSQSKALKIHIIA